jgi:hypothetical protein
MTSATGLNPTDPYWSQSINYVNGWYTTEDNVSTTIKIVPGASVVIVFRSGGDIDGKVSFDGSATVHIIEDGFNIANEGSLTFGDGPFWLWRGGSGGFLNAIGADSIFKHGNGPFYFYGGQINNVGTMQFGDGPFYFENGAGVSLKGGSNTVFGDGPFWFNESSMVTLGNSNTVFGVGDIWFNCVSPGHTLSNAGTWTLGGNGDPVRGN